MLASTYKPRPCEECKALFSPQRMGAKVCSPRCAMRLVKAKKVEERAQIKTRKEAIKTLPVLKAEAQKAFNHWVRTRDEAQPCISCGKPPQLVHDYQGGRDAGHYRSVGAAAHLRFHEDNCHAQCVACNQFKSGNAVDYRVGLVARLGIARVEALEADNEVRKWTADDLREIRKTYAAKARALKRTQGES